MSERDWRTMVDAREDGNVPGHATRTVYFRTSEAVAEVDSEIREFSKSLQPRGEGRRSAGQYADLRDGNDAEDILHSFRLSNDDSKKYDVKGKFVSHFVKKRNVIYERAKFNQCIQEEGETEDSFITVLYGLAEHCGYDALHEMIRDRIVVGIRDSRLAEKLQLDSELTLSKAVTQVRQAEAVKEQQHLVRGENHSMGWKKPETPMRVVLDSGSSPSAKTKRTPRSGHKPGGKDSATTKCGRCGKPPFMIASSAMHVMQCATIVPSADTLNLFVDRQKSVRSVSTTLRKKMHSWVVSRRKETNLMDVHGP